jgi:hypothetical protein
MRKLDNLIAAGAIALALSFSRVWAEQAPQWKGMITKEGELTIVSNPKKPMTKQDFLSLKEEWVLGGAQAKPEAAFSYVRHLAVDEAGSVYVLDSKESVIRVFDASGHFLKRIGRKGDGPGEFASPLRLSIDRTSKELVVSQNSRRISFFDLEGRYLRTLNTGVHWIPQGEVDSAGHIIGLEADFGSQEAWFALKKFDQALNLLAVLIKKPVPDAVIKGDPFAPVPCWALDEQDNVFFGFPDKYEIIVFDKSNKIQRIIRKEYDPVEIKSESKGTLSKLRPAFQSFFVDSLEYLYVRTWIPGPNENEFVYDIFDKEGRYLASQPLAGRLWIARRSYFYSVNEDEEGFHVLKKFSASRNIK